MFIRRFSTPAWLKNRHLQTAWGSFFRKAVSVPSTKVTIPLRDQTAMVAHFVPSTGSSSQDEGLTELCIILHGLTGSAESHYVLGMQSAILNSGLPIATLAINHRGSLGAECPSISSDVLYHAGLETDLEDVIVFVQNRWPQARLSAIGVSLSGNMLIRALGLQLLPHIAAAMAISVPFELHAAANRVDRGMGRLYRRYLVNRMQKIVHIKVKAGSFKGAREYWQGLKSFWGMDNFIIGPLHGFRNVHHYYREASCRDLVKHVQQPLLIIQAADDPLVPVSAWPAASDLPSNVEFEAYDRGGHVGFISPEGYWIEARVVLWLQSLVSNSFIEANEDD